MVKNTWVKVVNEDQDDDDDPAEYNYYYMQSNGKAYKWDNSSVKKRTIDGKKYAFDEDGKMLYGWVDSTGSRTTGDDGWKSALYYFGTWDDGSMKTGWQQLNVYDAYGDADDDADKWFYFNANGKRKEADDGEEYQTSTINGHKYSFDDEGVMIYKWNQTQNIGATGSSAVASNWAWYGTAEDGARVNKGWFKVVPKADAFDIDNDENHDDEAQWYYSNTDGTLVMSQIKKIKGKYYAFNEHGAMISGLAVLDVDSDGSLSVVASGDDVDSDYLDDVKDGDIVLGTANIYYFGDADNADTDGAMKTGNVTVNVDGDNYSFNFLTSGGTESRGAGTNGLYKKVYYKNGLKMAADSDDKYRAAIKTSDDLVTFVSSSSLRAEAQSISYVKSSSNTETIKYVAVTEDYYLIGTNGQLAKKKTNGVKDGDYWYFFSDSDGKITYYANSKDLLKALAQQN
jgi:hypothetical protein